MAELMKHIRTVPGEAGALKRWQLLDSVGHLMNFEAQLESLSEDDTFFSQASVSMPLICLTQCLNYLEYLEHSDSPEPCVLIGHSQGLITAFAISISDEWSLVRNLRDAVLTCKVIGEACQGSGTGLMMVKANRGDLDEYLKSNPQLELVIVNSPTDFVVSGLVSDLESATREISSETSMKARMLRCDFGFHSKRNVSLCLPVNFPLSFSGSECSIPIVDPENGVSSKFWTVHRVVESVISRPLDWTKVMECCRDQLVVDFGPDGQLWSLTTKFIGGQGPCSIVRCSRDSRLLKPEEILDVCRSVLDVDSISPESDLCQLGLDSLKTDMILQHLADIHAVSIGKVGFTGMKQISVRTILESCLVVTQGRYRHVGVLSQWQTPLRDHERVAQVPCLYNICRAWKVPCVENLSLACSRLSALVFGSVNWIKAVPSNIPDMRNLAVAKKNIFGSEPLVQVLYAECDEDRSKMELMMVGHHAFFDGKAMALLFSKLMRLVRGQIKFFKAPLYMLRVPSLMHLSPDIVAKREDYWTRELACVKPHWLRFGKMQTKALDYVSGDLEKYQLPIGLIHALASTFHVSSFVVVLAVLHILFRKMSGKKTTVVGVPVDLRDSDQQNQIGMFIFVAPTVLTLDGSETFSEVVRMVSDKLSAALHHALPLNKILGKMGSHMDVDEIMPVVFTSHIYGKDTDTVPGCEEHLFSQPFVPFRLALVLKKDTVGDGLMVAEYQKDRCCGPDVRRLFGRLGVLIGSITTCGRISTLQYLLPEEIQTVQAASQGPDVPLTRPNLSSQLSWVCSEWPDTVAVEYGTTSLTYANLWRLCTFHAWSLRSRLGTSKRIALYMPKTPELVMAAMSVILSGNSVFLMDVSYPQTYLLELLHIAKIQYVVVDEKTALLHGWLVSEGFSLVCMDKTGAPSDDFRGYKPAPEKRLPDVEQSSGCYHIFTSGSTGKPKLVTVPHSGIYRNTMSMIDRYHISHGDRQLSFASPAFDAFYAEMLTSLLSGATLVMVQGLEKSQRLSSQLLEAAINVVTLPASLLMVMEPVRLKTLVSAGEACPWALVRLWLSSVEHLVNAFGPSEYSVCATTYEVKELDRGHDTVPIGTPLPCTCVDVLDKFGCRVGVGIVGEVHLSGEGMSLGYDDPDQHRASFIPMVDSNKVMYKTGDLAYWDGSGRLVFVGRRSTIVKLIGSIRIDPLYVQNVMLNMPGIASVGVQASSDNSVLVAHVVPVDQTNLSEPSRSKFIQDIQSSLRNIVPSQFVPRIIHVRDSMPLARNGSKLDLKALDESCATMDTRLTKILSDLHICCTNPMEVLHLSSIQAVMLQASLEREHGVLVPIEKLYSSPARELASIIWNHVTVPKAVEPDLDLVQLVKEKLAQVSSTSTVSINSDTHVHGILITGASGMLGSRVMHHVMEYASDVFQVFCLVRDASTIPVSLQSKVRVIIGNVDRPRFGLESSEYEDLCKAVMIVFHVAAKMDFNSDLKGHMVNIDMMVDVLNFCKDARVIQLNYASSLGVFGFGSNDCRESVLLGEYRPMVGGYSESKWVSEMILREWKSINIGTSVNVFRIGRLVETGRKMKTFFTDAFITGVLSMGIAPDLDIPFDLTPVDWCAQVMTTASLSELTLDGTYHVIHPEPMSFREVINFLSARLQVPMEMVPYQDWLRVLDSSPHLHHTELYKLRPFLKGPFFKVADGHWPVFNSDFSQRYFSSLEIPPLPCSQEILSAYAESLISPIIHL